MSQREDDTERIPSPAELATRLRASRFPATLLPDDVAALAIAARRIQGVAEVMDELGLVTESDLQEWIDTEGINTVKLWLAPHTLPSDLAKDWAEKSLSGERCRAVLAEVVREAVICERLRDIAPGLKQYGGAARAIRTSRENVAFSLDRTFRNVDRADLRQQRRLLRLAITYFRSLLDEVKWDPEVGSPAIACRFGKSVLRLARIETIALQEVVEARNVLASIVDTEVLINERVPSFLLESHLRAYELSDDPQELAAAGRIAREVAAETHFESAALLTEFWCRVTDASANSVQRHDYLQRAGDSIEVARRSTSSMPFRSATLAVLGAIVDGLQHCQSTSAIRQVSVPFVTRRMESVDTEGCFDVLEKVLSSLSTQAEDGEYIFRDLTARILSLTARSAFVENNAAVARLEKSIALRDGKHWQNSLVGEQAGIDQALDMLELSRLTGDGGYRSRAIKKLLEQDRTYPNSPHALAQLGLQAESLGGHAGPIPLAAGSLTDPGLVSEIRSGNFEALYERTARRALAIGTLPQKSLGGRGSVVLLEERTGSSTFTLVVKRMARARLELDQKRSEHLRQQLSETTSSRFGVIEHIANFESTDPLDDTTQVVSVRRHQVGRTLAQAIKLRPSRTRRLLEETSRFLALIHAKPYSHTEPTRVRKDLREVEVGCWLKKVVPRSEVLEFFTHWFALIPDGIPNVERRDAHAHNWLVDSRDRILALDLDCTGWRPAGYELAQLTEDLAVLGPQDFDTREVALVAYFDQLVAMEIDINFLDLRQSYLASCVARWVRTLSDSGVSDESRMLATRNLETLVSEPYVSTETRQVVAGLLSHWSRKTGVARTEALERISPGTRRRISRAMAHHLRHDASTPMTSEGWVDSGVLADALREQGHPVTPERVLLVAGALGERRFEIDGESVRASYGHSRQVDIYKTPSAAPTGHLYHATSTANLRSIFEARDGIRHMKRNFVHMSTDIDTAHRAAQRRREATVVTEVDASKLAELYMSADGTTWLTSRVPVDALTVLPVHEVSRRKSESFS